MDREALNDYPMGRLRRDRDDHHLRARPRDRWTILGQIRPQIGHVYGYTLEPVEDAVTSYYDWSNIAPEWREAGIFPVISETALRATLGIQTGCSSARSTA